MKENVTAHTVTAERFRLVNDNGELRGLMKTVNDNPILEFLDDTSSVRLVVQIANNWPVIDMRDSHGNVRIELGSVNGTPALFFRDQNGDLRMGVALSRADGSPRILFLDDKQQVRFGVVSDTEGSPRVIAADQFGTKHRILWFSEAGVKDAEQDPH